MAAPKKTPALSLSAIRSGYGKADIVRDASLSVAPGEIVALLGQNGAGKTTLLKTVIGNVKARAGSIRVGDQDVTSRAATEARSSGVAYVPQGLGVFSTLTIAENLRVSGLVRAKERALAEIGLAEVYELFPILKEKYGDRASTMSGGQQQMLAIAMALMTRPRVLLLDEPSTGLAPALVERVMQTVQRINQQFGISVLLVEQNLKYALPVCDRAYVMKLGEIVHESDASLLDIDEQAENLL
jgi:ABC-type branched-chain amino acid transport systems, ATPase component